MVTHLFEFISQDLDLFFIFILFLRVLWKREESANQQPSAAPGVSHSRDPTATEGDKLLTAVHMPTETSNWELFTLLP